MNISIQPYGERLRDCVHMRTRGYSQAEAFRIVGLRPKNAGETKPLFLPCFPSTLLLPVPMLKIAGPLFVPLEKCFLPCSRRWGFTFCGHCCSENRRPYLSKRTLGPFRKVESSFCRCFAPTSLLARLTGGAQHLPRIRLRRERGEGDRALVWRFRGGGPRVSHERLDLRINQDKISKSGFL